MQLNQINRVAELLQTADGRDRLRRAWFWREAQRYAEAITVRDRQGNRVAVSTADQVIGRSVFMEGAYDPEILVNVAHVLDEHGIVPDQIVDVGANIGTSTLDLLARYPDASAISIEPDPSNYLLLRHNVMTNGIDTRVRTINVAVGDRDGTVRLTVNASNPGDHRVDSSTAGPSIEVPMRRLDQLAQAGDAVTLLSIDVQGYEGHVFHGAGDLLGSPALVEFWPARLHEVGGYSWFLAAVERYGTVLSVREAVRPVADLEELASGLAADSAADLLLLP